MLRPALKRMLLRIATWSSASPTCRPAAYAGWWPNGWRDHGLRLRPRLRHEMARAPCLTIFGRVDRLSGAGFCWEGHWHYVGLGIARTIGRARTVPPGHRRYRTPECRQRRFARKIAIRESGAVPEGWLQVRSLDRCGPLADDIVRFGESAAALKSVCPF